MINVGLTSVTFRKLKASEVLDFAYNHNFNVIEWGGDIHAPVGDVENAKTLAKLMQAKQKKVKVSSYGSYFKLGENKNYKDEFSKIIEIAKILNAPIIRIWAGTKGSDKVTITERKNLECELKEVCKMAKQSNIKVGLEYHRGTLTDNATSTLNLLQAINEDNLFTYWQPNPELTVQEHLKEIELLREYILMVHVFNWGKNNERYPLSEGLENWKQYIKAIAKDDICYLLEFVKDDSTAQAVFDITCLRSIVY